MTECLTIAVLIQVADYMTGLIQLVHPAYNGRMQEVILRPVQWNRHSKSPDYT